MNENEKIPWRLDEGQIEVVDDAVAEILRRKTPGECMLMVGEMWDFARLWIESAVCSEHPNWTNDQVSAEVRRRMSGEPDRVRHGGHEST